MLRGTWAIHNRTCLGMGYPAPMVQVCQTLTSTDVSAFRKKHQYCVNGSAGPYYPF